MKALLLSSVIALSPGLTLAAGPNCAVTDEVQVGLPAQGKPSTAALIPVPTLPSGAKTLTARAVDLLPAALQHIAEAGATLSDLADYHGMRRVVARTGSEFMILSVAPDGQAIVAGLMSDLSAADLVTVAGSNLTDIGTDHGLRGMLVRSGAQFQIFYSTPDDERVIPGVMWDVAGKNLTRQQIASIPGIVPTVSIGDSAVVSPQPAAPAPDLSIVQGTYFGTAGDPTAPRLWLFIDPLCSFSVRAMQQLQPYVANSQVQLAVIPLAVIDHETNGQSTTKALAMLSRPSGQMVAAWSGNDLRGPAAPEATERLRVNMAAAQSIRLEGTPTLIWRKSDGSEGRSDGLPADLNALISSLGK